MFAMYRYNNGAYHNKNKLMIKLLHNFNSFCDTNLFSNKYFVAGTNTKMLVIINYRRP